MSKLCFIALSLIAVNLYAQEKAPAPPPEYGWKHGLVAGLTLTQVAFTDWAAGGENSLSYTITADGKSVDDLEKTNWITTYKFAFGQTRLGDQGLRKTDDVIDLSTVLTYKVGEYVNPYAAATMKTQFAKGFEYSSTGARNQVSAFFDPAYLTQSVGAGYQPTKEIKTRIGVALREVITSQFNQYTDDPATTNEVEKTTVDGGIESVTNVDWQIAENILFTSQFKMLDEVVVRNNSQITAKVNKYVTTILSLQLINEKRVSPRTQVKESIALGLSYTLF
jgi:hypothetical protein